MGWLSRLFGAREPSGLPAPSSAAAERFAEPPNAADPESAVPADAGLLLASLLGGAPPIDKDLTADEQRFVAALDGVLAQGEIADSLLPRAAAFVPQLLALLRQSDATLGDIAARIAQDAPLAAEVLRAASSAARGGVEVQYLAQAVQRVGAAGVQQAVARVIFRPMYGGGGSLGVRAGPWLWLFSERLAEAATSQARTAGLPAFDGYLAGLLQSTGWMIALRIADKAGIPVDLPQSLEAAAAVEARAHRLFGLAAQRWEITPGFALFTKDAAETPWARSSLPLAHCLRQAQAAVLARPAP